MLRGHGPTTGSGEPFVTAFHGGVRWARRVARRCTNCTWLGRAEKPERLIVGRVESTRGDDRPGTSAVARCRRGRTPAPAVPTRRRGRTRRPREARRRRWRRSQGFDWIVPAGSCVCPANGRRLSGPGPVQALVSRSLPLMRRNHDAESCRSRPKEEREKDEAELCDAAEWMLSGRTPKEPPAAQHPDDENYDPSQRKHSRIRPRARTGASAAPDATRIIPSFL